MCPEAVLPGLASWSPAKGTKLAHPGRGSETLTFPDLQLKGVRMTLDWWSSRDRIVSLWESHA